MRKFTVYVAIAAVLLIAAASVRVMAQTQTPVATSTASIAWDYPDADLSAGGVTRFEVQYDGGTWADAGMAKLAGATATYSTPIGALTPGSHSVAVRACNASLCGDSTSPLAFVLAVKPAQASNLRVIGG